MEKIILFDVKDAKKINKIASQMRIKVYEVNPMECGGTLQDIVDGKKIQTISSTIVPSKGLMLMCDVTQKHMDKLLFAVKRDNLDVGYKAILTKTNAKWSLAQMLLHMEMEEKSFLFKHIKEVPL
ncbi:MAG: DUF3783 domain-containing protein [Lachnospira sp.]|jgi:hypothetical protein|nr:DUF3783 domain-containing protein [Lachnospira sp.]